MPVKCLQDLVSSWKTVDMVRFLAKKPGARSGSRSENWLYVPIPGQRTVGTVWFLGREPVLRTGSGLRSTRSSYNSGNNLENANSLRPRSTNPT